MRIGRTIAWSLVILVVLLIVAGAVMYRIANRPPEIYQRPALSDVQKKEVASHFFNRILDFGTLLERNEPFTWTIVQDDKSDELNETLASLAEIADKAQEGKAGEVHKTMSSIGIEDPVIVMGDNFMTLMMHSRDFDKVLSADISLAYTSDNKIWPRLVSSRIGQLPLPVSTVRKWLRSFRNTLAPRVAASKPVSTAPKVAGISSDDLATICVSIVSAIVDEEPMNPEFAWPVNHIRFRIEGIEIKKGSLTLKVRPLRQKASSRP